MLLSMHVTSVLGSIISPYVQYGLLLELHALTLVARSYALLLQVTVVHASQQKVLPLIVRKDKDLASWAEIGRPRTGCRNLTHSS